MQLMTDARFHSPPHEELLVAATQQMHITERRLAAHFTEPSAMQEAAQPEGAHLDIPLH